MPRGTPHGDLLFPVAAKGFASRAVAGPLSRFPARSLGVRTETGVFRSDPERTPLELSHSRITSARRVTSPISLRRRRDNRRVDAVRCGGNQGPGRAESERTGALFY